MATFDRIIAGGTIVDGKGHAAYTGDIAIKDGRIAAMGRDLGSAKETVNADGLIVTPGWVDIHTHYDAQVTWDAELLQSSWHGVTSAILGNCGVGFAPARPDRRSWLINLMEGVEDIPGVSLEAGMDWGWESFPEYIDALDRKPHTFDIGTQLTHGALRCYVMGERGAADEPASEADLAEMARLIREGMAAGALGFSTSRTPVHVDVDGVPVPGTHAPAGELIALARAVKDSGHGLMELVLTGAAGEDVPGLDRDMGIMREVAEATRCRLMYLQAQNNGDARQWRRQLAICEQAARDGLEIVPQVAGRPVPIMFCMAGEHPWRFMPSYAEIADLPPAERVRRMADPAMRARLLAEEDPNDAGFSLLYKNPTLWDTTYVAGDPIRYLPDRADSVAEIARRENRSPWEVAYDLLLENEGNAFLLYTVAGYADGNPLAVHEMLRHPLSVLGLSDAGAHCRFVCDGGVHTYVLTAWYRDRDENDPLRLPLEYLVRKLTGDNANVYGLTDRGVLEPGRRADINLIDLGQLGTSVPEMVYDLPAQQPRLLARATGYAGTYVRGELIQANGELTGARPGRVIRGGRRH
ncbi:MAG: amidohydrolase family protein [Gammaproteobacteria bacterium]|nr:amidohydrolase family protein [Gammaproteobacteria bacterium]